MLTYPASLHTTNARSLQAYSSAGSY